MLNGNITLYSRAQMLFYHIPHQEYKIIGRLYSESSHTRSHVLVVCGTTLCIGANEDQVSCGTWGIVTPADSSMFGCGRDDHCLMAESEWHRNARIMISGQYYPCETQPDRQKSCMLLPGIV